MWLGPCTEEVWNPVADISLARVAFFQADQNRV
jgi:hypothetical protein